MANLAARQYGIVTRDQLNELGYTDRMIDHSLRTGRLHAWHRNVFAVGHGGLSRHGLCMAAVMFRGEGALISFQSAVWLWGLERKLEIPVNVSVRWRGHPQNAIGLHHCPALRDEDFVDHERLPVTAVPRTLARLRVDREDLSTRSARSTERTDSNCSTLPRSIGSRTRSADTVAADRCKRR